MTQVTVTLTSTKEELTYTVLCPKSHNEDGFRMALKNSLIAAYGNGSKWLMNKFYNMEYMVNA